MNENLQNSVTKNPIVRAIGKVLKVVAGIAFAIALILAYNGLDWLQNGNPTMPKLEGRWWGGYYNLSDFGKQWCVARFFRGQQGGLQMILLSPVGEPQIFDVERDSFDDKIIRYTFVDNSTTPPIKIEAGQLYAGARYYIGPLFAGNFKNIGKMNEDVAIQGTIDLIKDEVFGIEPITDDRLVSFWNELVRPGQPSPSPADILKTSGVTTP